MSGFWARYDEVSLSQGELVKNFSDSFHDLDIFIGENANDIKKFLLLFLF